MHGSYITSFKFVFFTNRKTLKLRFPYCNTTTERQRRQQKNEVILSQPIVLMHTPDVLRCYFLQPFDLWSGNINQ